MKHILLSTREGEREPQIRTDKKVVHSLYCSHHHFYAGAICERVRAAQAVHETHDLFHYPSQLMNTIWLLCGLILHLLHSFIQARVIVAMFQRHSQLRLLLGGTSSHLQSSPHRPAQYKWLGKCRYVFYSSITAWRRKIIGIFVLEPTIFIGDTPPLGPRWGPFLMSELQYMCALSRRMLRLSYTNGWPITVRFSCN